MIPQLELGVIHNMKLAFGSIAGQSIWNLYGTKRKWINSFGVAFIIYIISWFQPQSDP
jgi:hypothetical protein